MPMSLSASPPLILRSCRYAKSYEDGGKAVQDKLASLKEHAKAIRVIVHTQPAKVNLGAHKCHMMEVQVNGGSVADKVDFAYGLFEKEVSMLLHVLWLVSFLQYVALDSRSQLSRVVLHHVFHALQVTVDSVVQQNDMIDTIAITKGRGTQGVITRWGITRLPRKTHRGLRKVACIGAWHPARVSWSVARSGQHGFHHRTEINKKVRVAIHNVAW